MLWHAGFLENRICDWHGGFYSVLQSPLLDIVNVFSVKPFQKRLVTVKACAEFPEPCIRL